MSMESTIHELAMPVADWVTVADLVADPYPVYARLRDEMPVAWVPAVKKVLITRFEDCTAAERNPDVFSSQMATAPMMTGMAGRPMIRKDGAEHAAERKAVSGALRPRTVNARWTETFRANTHKYLSRLAEIGPDEAELNRDFSAPVASQNLMDLIGFKGVSVEDFAEWSAAFMAGNANGPGDEEVWDRCERARAAANAALDEVLPYLRDNPDETLASIMLQHNMPEESVRVNLFLAISGGVSEPKHTISNSVLLLDEHPHFRPPTSLKHGEPDYDEAWRKIFHETVRYYTPIAMTTRETKVVSEMRGVQIPPGTQIGIVLASGNRDERAFIEPNTFNPQRAEVQHLAFGEGAHMCAGMWVADAEVGRIAVPALYERFPNFRIDRRRPLEWEGWIFRGMKSTPVTWG